jgi:hypothetical protein
MNRRKFLGVTSGGLGVILAGCSDESSEDPDSDPVDTSNIERSDWPVEMDNMETEVEEDSYTDPFESSVTVLSDPSESQPLLIQVSLTNTADTVYSYKDRRSALYWGIANDRTTHRLYPLEEVREIVAHSENGWYLQSDFDATEFDSTREIDPGETHSAVLVLCNEPVLGVSEVDPIGGEHTFNTEFEISEGFSDDTTDPTIAQHEFTIDVPGDAPETEFVEDELESSIEMDSMDTIAPLSYSISVTEPTSENPLTVTLEITNTGDEAYVYGDKRGVLFRGVKGETSFRLYPPESVDYTYGDRRWYTESDFSMSPEELKTETLEPDESKTQELVLLQDMSISDRRATLPREEQFSVQFFYMKASSDKNLTENDPVEWGFTLRRS